MEQRQGVSAGLHAPGDTVHGRVWLGQRVGVQNSCRGRGEPPAVASVNFKEVLSSRGHWEWGLGALGDMAPEEATGLCAMHQSHLVRS